MATKKRKKAAKKSTKRRKKSTKKTSKCKIVTVCGKRRKICRNTKGHITSNKKV